MHSLRSLAATTGKSVAGLVRRGVEVYLATQSGPGREGQLRRALAAGRFSSGRKDVSTNHDRYLADAFRE